MRKDGALYHLFSDRLSSTSVVYGTATGQAQPLHYYPWGSIRRGGVPVDRRLTSAGMTQLSCMITTPVGTTPIL